MLNGFVSVALISVVATANFRCRDAAEATPTPPHTTNEARQGDDDLGALMTLKAKLLQDSKDRQTFDELLRHLGASDPVTRANAASIIGLVARRIDPVERSRAIQALIRALRDGDQAVRRESASALGLFGPDAASAVTALAERLEEVKADVSVFAAEALGEIGPAAEPAVAQLTTAFKTGPSTFGWLGEAAAVALGRIGPGARAAVPTLKDAVARYGGAYAIDAAAAVALIDPGNKDALDALDRMMHREGAVERRLIVARLLEIGRISPAGAIPILKRAVRDPDSDVREASTNALDELGQRHAPTTAGHAK